MRDCGRVGVVLRVGVGVRTEEQICERRALGRKGVCRCGE